MTSTKAVALRSTYVKPPAAIGRKECQLITYDLKYIAIDYIQWLLIYRSDAKFEEIEEKLKNGLGVILESFYPLAGKFGIDEEGILKVEYDDDMNGAEFKLSVAEDIQVADMAEDEVYKFKDFIPCNHFSNLNGLYHPLFFVQLTKLKDGFALGCAINHSIADGTSSWHFLKAWAERCMDPTYIPVTPFHDRTKVRNTRVRFDIPLDPNDSTFTTSTIKPHISQRLFSFSESTITKIKSDTNKHLTSSPSVKQFTTFHCVAAHVWRAVTRARQLVPEDITTLVVIVNSRHKLDPPVQETYFGNILMPAIIKMTAGVLYNTPPDTIAVQIQQAIEKLDSKTIDASITEWEKEARVLNPSMYRGHNLIIRSFTNFKFYELDFGWGNPDMVMNGYNNRYDGAVLLVQGKSGGRSIDIDITLDDKVMETLKMDADFLIKDE